MFTKYNNEENGKPFILRLQVFVFNSPLTQVLNLIQCGGETVNVLMGTLFDMEVLLLKQGNEVKSSVVKFPQFSLSAHLRKRAARGVSSRIERS